MQKGAIEAVSKITSILLPVLFVLAQRESPSVDGTYWAAVAGTEGCASSSVSGSLSERTQTISRA